MTQIPLERGGTYLVVSMDGFSRAVLASRLSNSMGVEFCLEALQEALLHHGPPAFFNSAQGAQFTAVEFVAVLLAHQAQRRAVSACMPSVRGLYTEPDG